VEAQQKAAEILEQGVEREKELKHAEACSVLGRAESGAEQGWHPNSGVPLAYANARATFRAGVLARAAAQLVNQCAEILWERADTLALFCAALNLAVLKISHIPRFAPLGGKGDMGGIWGGEDDYLSRELEAWFTLAARRFKQGESITGREARLREFCAQYRTTITAVYGAAPVDKRDMARWRKRELPDSSIKSQRIEAVLRGDIPWSRSPKKNSIFAPSPPLIRPPFLVFLLG
jgi:hypothetical protein